MCGITGLEIRKDVSWDLASVLREMTGALRHRGPDGEGFHVEGRLGLGHRRLSIIDLGGGAQPMSNEDGTLWITFNGEIYNYEALGRVLEGKGHVFRSRCDTEVILHAYEEWGPACLDRFRGMFAFAILDSRKKSWFLARDRLGKKPLFYFLGDSFFAFASEIKALLKVPGIPRAVDPEALFHYAAFQYVPHPLTMFRGIRKLSPAHFLLVGEEAAEPKRYWLPIVEEDPGLTAFEIRSRLEALFYDAVKLRLRSDVPLGAFLSGGIDSTLVAGVMSRLSPGRVKTFSIGFEEMDYDERPYARLAAERYGTEHEEFVVTAKAADVVPELVKCYDEPFADSSALPTWHLAKMTAQRVKVALSGDGGDELFYGYDRYAAARWGGVLDRGPPFVKRILALVGRLIPAGLGERRGLRRLKRFLVHLPERPIERYLSWISIFRAEDRAGLFSPDFLASLPHQDPAYWLSRETPPSGGSPAKEAAVADLFTYLPGDLLTKVDIASMAHGLEVRCPFLDHPLVEFALRIPMRPQLKLLRSRKKRLLRGVFRKWLPDPIARRGKMGFGVPVSRWFRQDLKPMLIETLKGPPTHDFFNRACVEGLVDEHLSGRFDHGPKLWALLMFERWRAAYLG